MGPASENAGYVPNLLQDRHSFSASMGPASENAGYGRQHLECAVRERQLQWVQRPRTPVMDTRGVLYVNPYKLQWVQRPRTPVMWIGSSLNLPLAT